jgi:hypothetical protein
LIVMQEEWRGGVGAGDAEFSQFWAAGQPAKGEFNCSACSYGIIVHTLLPTCPMCGGEAWEQASWSPLTRVRQAILR